MIMNIWKNGNHAQSVGRIEFTKLQNREDLTMYILSIHAKIAGIIGRSDLIGIIVLIGSSLLTIFK